MERSDEPPVQLSRPDGLGPFVFVCEHASNRIPAEYHNLGVTEAVRQSHAAWDIGALQLSLELSQRFDSPLVASTVSRLVYDCNRAPDSKTAIVVRSEQDDVPGNIGLSDAQRRQRVDSVYHPFENQLSSVVDKGQAQNNDVVLVTIHSFTPSLRGEARSVEIGVLHDTDARFANDLLMLVTNYPDYKIERNQPYGPDDDVTHTLKKHAMPRQLRNVMLEIRNDLLRTDSAITAMAEFMSGMLNDALKLPSSKNSPVDKGLL